MASIIEGYSYDIFISYRQKDNKYDGWITEFVDNLKKELEATFKEEVSVFFDINPHDGLLETYDVGASLKEKLKCLIFIPIISRTYCDPKSFAWEHEFKAFVEQASKDKFGLKVKLPNGNVASRVLPVRIYDLDTSDIKLCESVLGGALRGVDFIYKSPGVNRPLLSREENLKDNLNHTNYRDQINKVANSIKEIIRGLKGEQLEFVGEPKEFIEVIEKPALQEKSIIILPFENISPDPDQEYFSDGLTEEIITDLSNIQDLLVISRSSAMTFKRTKSTINEITDKVNVRYVLEGSVRKAGNNLRITAQLIDGSNDSLIWAKKYSGTLDDVFYIQEKVSRSIVNALKLKLIPEKNQKISEHDIKNIQAYECYLKANAEVLKFTESSTNQALRYLQSALDITGHNALIYSGIAFAYWQLVNLGIEQEDYLLKAEEYGNKALASDPNSVKAYATLGWIYHLKSDPRKSSLYLRKALSINPNDPFALQGLAAVYIAIVGKISAAISLVEKLQQIEPFDFLTNFLHTCLYFYSGQFVEFLRETQKVIKIYSEIPYVIFTHALALAYNKRTKEAFRFIELNTDKNMDNALAKLGCMVKYSLEGKLYKVLQILTPDFKKTCLRDPTFCHHLSGIFSLLNEKDEALKWIENAINAGFLNYPLLADLDPFLENIRGEERFKKLMKRVKYEWENFEV